MLLLSLFFILGRHVCNMSLKVLSHPGHGSSGDKKQKQLEFENLVPTTT